MKQLRRGILTLTALLLCLVAVFPAYSAQGPGLYYSVALGGYSPISYGAPETLELSAGMEFLPRAAMNPAVFIRLLVPFSPFDFSMVRASAGVELSLGYFLRHPFAWVSPRRLAWTPSVGASFSARLADLSDSGWVFSLSPVRLFSGRGYQSFGTLVFPFSSSLESEGWGMRLLEFSYLVR